MIDAFSIIIPTLNEERYLPQLLNSLLQQSYTGKVQIIIVDGKSDDKTIAIAKNYKKKFAQITIVTSKRSIAVQRNLGVTKAIYTTILFLDADIILPKHFLLRVARKKCTNNMFVRTFFLWGSERNFLDYLSFLLFFPLFIPVDIWEKATPGGMLLTNKRTHTAIGGFREAIKVGEDLDYGLRLKAIGVPYRYYFFPYAFHSPRRLRKEGRIGFWLQYLKGYYYIKRYGPESLHKHIHYPFGEYDK